MIQIFYGMGKGKTSTLNGMAIRAKGKGFTVSLFRFLKGSANSEDISLTNLGIEIVSLHPSKQWVKFMDDPSEVNAAKNKALETLKKAQNCSSQVIILDEVLDLCAKNVDFLSEDELLNFITNLAKQHEVLISGHVQLPKILEIADLVTFFEAEKHYFTKGVQAREGFDY